MAANKSPSSPLPSYEAVIDYPERLNLLFSPFRTRALNPEHYEQKLKFWVRSIEEYVTGFGRVTFSIMDLQDQATHLSRLLTLKRRLTLIRSLYICHKSSDAAKGIQRDTCPTANSVNFQRIYSCGCSKLPQPRVQKALNGGGGRRVGPIAQRDEAPPSRKRELTQKWEFAVDRQPFYCQSAHAIGWGYFCRRKTGHSPPTKRVRNRGRYSNRRRPASGWGHCHGGRRYFVKRQPDRPLKHHVAKKKIPFVAPNGDTALIQDEFSPLKNADAKDTPRVTKPPGGDCSDIFATGPLTTPPLTPRKKTHMTSNIFGPAESSAVTRKPVDNTCFNKLFGEITVTNGAESVTKAASPTVPPRVSKDHQKSNVLFTGEKVVANGTTNGSATDMNGHTNGHTNGHGPKTVDAHDSASGSGNSSGCVTPNGSLNGDAEPRSNGHKGTNGTTNGHGAAPEMGTPKKRIPPGGHSTKLW